MTHGWRRKRSLLRAYAVELPQRGRLVDRVGRSVVDRLYLRTCTSSRPGLWASTHAALAAPFLIARPARRYIARPGGETVRITCVGRPAIFRRLLGVVGPTELVRVDRRRSLWSPSALARLDADLVAVEIHPWAAASFRREGWLIAPHAVRWRAPAADVPPARPSKSLKSDLRLIASQGYALEVCRDEEAWREFFCRMVVPLARRRFGASAIYASRSLVSALAGRGELLFVVEDGVRLAGVCVLTRGAKLWVAFLGVRDGDFALIQRGVISALYRFILERAHESGVRTLDFGRTSPSLDGGLARYKAKWGFAPERDVLARLVALRPDPGHAGLAEVFAAHPFLVDEGDRVAVFPTQP